MSDKDLLSDEYLLIRRYSKCASRILGLFPNDPLALEDPAHTYIERLESVLDHGRLTMATPPLGVNWRARAEMLEATVKRLFNAERALDTTEIAAGTQVPSSWAGDRPLYLAKCCDCGAGIVQGPLRELRRGHGHEIVREMRFACTCDGHMPIEGDGWEPVTELMQRELEERAKRHEQGSDYWKRRAEALKKDFEQRIATLRAEMESAQAAVRSLCERDAAMNVPEPISPLTCSACDQPIPMPRRGETWETRDGSSRGTVGRVPALNTVPDGWGLVDGTLAGTVAMHLDAVRSGYWHRVSPLRPEPAKKREQELHEAGLADLVEELADAARELLRRGHEPLSQHRMQKALSAWREAGSVVE